jgi:hypothetical protein
MNNFELLGKLNEINACKGAKEWILQTGYDFKTAWEKCERGDWLLFWAEKDPNVSKRNLVWAAGECATIAIPRMRDQRSIDAVNACIAFGNGEITEEELHVFAIAATNAHNANASNASIAAYYASNGDAYNAVFYSHFEEGVLHKDTTKLKQCADIVRNRIKI